MNARKHEILILLLVLPAALSVGARSLRSLVQQGNSLYAAGNYAGAISRYEQALVENPSSMEALFNQANSYYCLDDLDKAVDGFRRVAGESRDMPLVTRARYNLGNCFFTRGMKQRDSDLQKALDNLQTAIGYWRQVLDVERDNAKAARNIEVARLVIKDIIDRINKQQQQQQQQQQLAEKLKELLERQESLAQKTRDTAAAVQQRQLDPNQAAQQYTDQRAEQSDIRRETEQVAAQLQQQDPNQPQPPQVRQAAEELAQATDSQKTAESQLGQSAGSAAQQSEEKAAEHIAKALEALSQSDQQPQQDQQGDPQQQPQPQQASEPNEPAEPNEPQQPPQQQTAPDATAQEILDREQKQKEQRQMMQRPRYQKVDKDW
ncbi:MAG TPA: tetratricopeptide repeat protein [Phycisphaerales bacterium]|nr:tetratricopeptide repeat protein [Phycisphaerales bacterium]